MIIGWVTGAQTFPSKKNCDEPILKKSLLLVWDDVETLCGDGGGMVVLRKVSKLATQFVSVAHARPEPIMLFKLPIMLLSIAPKI